MKSLISWDSDPVQSFKGFVGTDAFAFAKTAQRLPADGMLRSVSGESARIYIFMFSKVSAWILEPNKAFSTVTHGDLAHFVNRVDGGKRVLNSKIGYRYLRLLERCYQHLGVIPNPTKQVILATDRTDLPKDDAGRTLSPDQLQQFFDALPVDPPRRRRLTAFDV